MSAAHASRSAIRMDIGGDFVQPASNKGETGMILALALLALQQPPQSALRNWSDCLVTALTSGVNRNGAQGEAVLQQALSECGQQQALVGAQFRRSPGGAEGGRIYSAWQSTIVGAMRTRLELWREILTPRSLLSREGEWMRCLVGAVAAGEAVPAIIYGRCQMQENGLSTAWRNADPNGASLGVQRVRRDLHLMVDAMLSQVPSAGRSPTAGILPQFSRSFMVGRWTDTGNCDTATAFNSDGRFEGALAGRGTWGLQGNQLQLTYPDHRVLRMRLAVVDRDTLTVTQENGSSARSVRCQSRAASGGSSQPPQSSGTGAGHTTPRSTQPAPRAAATVPAEGSILLHWEDEGQWRPNRRFEPWNVLGVSATLRTSGGPSRGQITFAVEICNTGSQLWRGRAAFYENQALAPTTLNLQPGGCYELQRSAPNGAYQLFFSLVRVG